MATVAVPSSPVSQSQSTPPVTPERIFQFAWGYAPPLTLEAAVHHGIFDKLDAGPMSVPELHAATGCSKRGLAAILNLLVGLEFLTRDQDDKYALTPVSAAFLVSGKPGYLGGILRHMGHDLIPRWLQLDEVVATGKPATAVNQQQQGTAFFEGFVADLFHMGYPVARELAAHLRLDRAAEPVSVLDLAAGSGVWSIALAQSAPGVRVTAVDWPGVLSVTRATAARFGLEDRYKFVEGDLNSADFGSGHNVATLGHILHSEGTLRSKELLKKTHAALAPGGTIAIAEFLVDADRRGPVNGLIFAVNMLVHTDAGDAYSFAEISEWLKEAGFSHPRTLDTHGPSPLILATKE